MKTVFTNSEVCHVWAQQRQYEGRNGTGSIFFRGGTIYSYGEHFPMARILREHGFVALLNSDSYSVTTSRHQNTVYWAVNHMRCFHVPNVMASGKKQHKKNYQYLIADYKRCLKKAAATRTWQGMWLDNAQKALDSANEYTKLFKLGYRQKAFEYDEKELKAALARERKQARKRNAARREKEEKEYRKQLAAWRAGGYRGHLLSRRGVMLRVKGDNVETTRGASFPVKHAERAWPLILACRKKTREFVTNGKTIHLGHYQIDKIDVNGNVRAGCHNVKFIEIQRVAKELGLV